MTDWNALYETKETPWDKGQSTPVLEEAHFLHPELFQGKVLVPGCGTGYDARSLAHLGCEVVGLDIAPLAIEQARKLDSTGSVDFRLENLFDLSENLRGAFDFVWEHTCLCALPLEMRNQYVRGVKSALKPEGRVMGVFFLNPDMDPDESGPPFGITVDELISLWTAEGFTVVEQWEPKTGYSGRVGRELFLWLRQSL
ncbi:methyltransferase domain-containing protein [soil metagenome]